MTIKTNKQKHQKTTSAGEHVAKLEPLSFAGGNINGAATVGNNMAVPQKLKTELPCDPASPLLGRYSKELKAGA